MSGLVIQASFCVETTTGNLAAGGNIVISDGGTPTASIVIPAAAVSLWDTTTCRSGITYTENQNFQITVSLVDEAVEATVSYVLMLAQATK